MFDDYFNRTMVAQWGKFFNSLQQDSIYLLALFIHFCVLVLLFLPSFFFEMFVKETFIKDSSSKFPFYFSMLKTNTKCPQFDQIKCVSLFMAHEMCP